MQIRQNILRREPRRSPFASPSSAAALLLTSLVACAGPEAKTEASNHETHEQPSPLVTANGERTAALVTEDSTISFGQRVPPATFAPCQADPEVECGTLSVPLDYAVPNGQQIELGTARLPATSERKKGILFINPGGPGGSGVNMVLAVKELFGELRRDFDIVSFDPRGVARSGFVFCPFPLPPSPTSFAELPAFHDEIGRRALACTQQIGPLATRMGTTSVARDMDRFRAALREHELNYLGFSYGSILGASYASQFPHRTRAMVLDGVLSPSWLGDYLTELESEGSSGAELALQRVDVLCRADAACPLRVAGVIATFDRLFERLTRAPVAVDGDVIDGATLQELVIESLNVEPFLPAMVNALALADNGDYSGFTGRPSLRVPSNLDEVPESAVTELFAVICNDHFTRLTGQDYAPLFTVNRAQHRRLASLLVDLAIPVCSMWPRSPVAPVLNFAGRNPILLIGNDYDPATIMPWSRDMATALGPKARLLRYVGGGHTAYASGNACIDNAVHTYLRELKVPQRGASCPGQPISFDPSAARVASTQTMAEILRRINPKLPRMRAEVRR